ncbi:restriction endonuclease subunit S [Agathobacter rectalis]|mgnify:CR=1 FL=1|jgi:type I restriction enzyme S subunit|uniref:Type I restriction modification DNA specificity domain-containing protein n=1 Tax=Agathobacter rectalis TaxID=39491 RepID=A0A5S4VL40_9FIRM|nr:restriction endonuclease subunit S [Agathobacter rectalis]TYL59936.1 hypothetical protein FYL31_07395 [Agathobacter rectalis]
MTKKWVNIADVLFFQEGPGVRNTQYTTSGVKLLNVANLVDGKVDLSKSDRYISEEEAYGKYRHFLCDDGDFVIASSGIKVEYIDKKMGFVDASMLPLCMNTSTIRFKVLDENQLRIRYFMYYLKSKHFKEQLTKQITGSAQLNYGPSHLKKMIMPLIDITVQDEIISCMDKLQSIIETRQRELIELDRLMKARFVELFGDPRSNPFGFEKKRLKDTCKVITGNTPSRAIAEYYGDYIEWIKTDNIVSGILNPTQATESLSEKGMNVGRTVEKDSILMACIAGSIASIGRVCITDRTVAFNQQINAVVPEQYNILFLYVLFQMSKDYLVEDINMALKGILSKSKLEEKEFIIPPMDLQEQFSDFVKQVNKSKFDTMTFAPIYAIINLYLHTYFYQGRR